MSYFRQIHVPGEILILKKRVRIKKILTFAPASDKPPL